VNFVLILNLRYVYLTKICGTQVVVMCPVR